MIGRLLNTLANLGRLEDTAVMITCDHGTELMDHGQFSKSPDHLFAHNTQLNWIVRLPDGHPHARAGRGKTVDAFVQNHDVVPTALDLLGLLDKWSGAESVERPQWAGQSAKKLIEGEADTLGRDHVITGWANSASVRTREWNYTVKFETPDGTERLHDLRADPFEHKDVSSDHPDVVREQRRRLEALLNQELGTRLPDGPQGDTVAPCRAYYGSRPTRHEEQSGFV
jgi:choline-sulfatase